MKIGEHLQPTELQLEHLKAVPTGRRGDRLGLAARGAFWYCVGRLERAQVTQHCRGQRTDNLAGVSGREPEIGNAQETCKNKNKLRRSQPITIPN